MKAIFTLFLSMLALASTAQRTTYDTTISGWNARVSYDPSRVDSSEGIIYFPGAGEVGTDPSKLLIYGPHYWMQNGWDGAVQLGNGTHYPIYISLQPPSQSVLTGPNIKVRLDAILKRYKIKRKAFYLTGPSAGGFASWTFVTYQATAGDHSYGDMVTAIMCPESVKPNSQQAATPAYPQNTVQWIQRGKYALGFNQINDGGRDMQTYYSAMNAVAPGAATYYSTDFGGGSHCCFQEFWDPYITSWSTNSVGLPIGAGVPEGWNTYQWLLRKGDTSLTSPPATIPANQAPVSKPGSAQAITLPVSSVTLDGSASSDPDGTIASYAWSQVSGPTTATIAAVGGKTTLVSGLAAGTYVFQLKVTDNSSATGTATVQVTVSPAANQAPSANAGANQGITLPTNSVTLNGSASSDPDGTIASYAWSQVSGPTTATLGTAGAVSTTAGGLAAGTYVFRLTVKDNSGATATDDINVTVSPAANQAPSANAGANQGITLPVSSVTLNGSASSDPDGTIASYAWSQVSGPTTATLGTAGAVSTTAGGLAAGTYVFRLTVKDNSGATATDDINVTVSPAANQAPSANAGANQGITLPVSSVTLSGSASSDPDGTIASYAWSQVSGPTTATLGTAGAVSTTAGGLAAGTYVFRLTVKDNSGATATDDVNVTVSPAPNQLPVANAGAAQAITLPVSSVTLNGSASSDPDGTISSYAWSQVSGPTTATLGTAGTVSTSAGGLVVGTYIFQLKVTDNSGATATAQVKVTVADAANQNPVANAGSNQTITLPTSSVTVNGSASSDPNGSISSYVWSQVSGPTTATMGTAGAVTTTVGSLVAGTYVFELKVTDNSGATATDDVNVTVNAAANQAPVANAGANISITLPTSSVTLNGSASSDPDGTIASYAWSQVSGPTTATLGTAGAVSTTAGGLAAGTYVFRLTVKDNSGATTTDDVNVTVNAAANQAPVAEAGANLSITLPTSSVTLSGSASSDPDGTIASYAWSQVSGPTTATLGTAGAVTTTAGGLVQGTYVFRLTVKDNSGATATDDVNVTVNTAANQTPSANAGANLSITLPTSSVTLDGSASSDPDGTIASYAWSQVSGPTTATLGTAGAVSTSAGGLVQGTYVFRLTVKDNSGATATDDVNVMVNAAATPPPAANKPPVANAGPDQNIDLPVSSISLNGTSSYDPDGTIASYNWLQVSGIGGVSITNSNTATPALYGLKVGTYVFQLTVKDNAGAEASDQVSVVVNQAAATPSTDVPKADAGTDTAVSLTLNNGAMLNGSGSTDAGGTITGYEWTQVSGPAGAVIGSPTSTESAVSNLVAGVYVFQLTITNDKGGRDSATVQVRVIDNQRNDGKWSLYPNPAHDIVNLSISDAVNGKMSIVVADINGRILLKEEVTKSQQDIIIPLNVSGLAKGYYFIKILISSSNNQNGSVKPKILPLIKQ